MFSGKRTPVLTAYHGRHTRTTRLNLMFDCKEENIKAFNWVYFFTNQTNQSLNGLFLTRLFKIDQNSQLKYKFIDYHPHDDFIYYFFFFSKKRLRWSKHW